MATNATDTAGESTIKTPTEKAAEAVRYIVETTTLSQKAISFSYTRWKDTWGMDVVERMIQYDDYDWEPEPARTFLTFLRDAASEEIANAWWQAVDHLGLDLAGGGE
jgi:hypothetical protein